MTTTKLSQNEKDAFCTLRAMPWSKPFIATQQEINIFIDATKIVMRASKKEGFSEEFSAFKAAFLSGRKERFVLMNINIARCDPAIRELPYPIRRALIENKWNLSRNLQDFGTRLPGSFALGDGEYKAHALKQIIRGVIAIEKLY